MKKTIYLFAFITGGLATMLYREGAEKGDATTTAKGRDLAKTILAQFFRRSLNEINFTEDGVEFGF